MHRKTNEQLLHLEAVLGKDAEQAAAPSDAGTATDSDDSLEPLDLNEDDDKGTEPALIPRVHTRPASTDLSDDHKLLKT